MFRKLLLGGLLVIVGLPSLILGVEHLRGRRFLEAKLAELRARGEPMRLDQLVPPPPPPASNGITLLLSTAPALGMAGNVNPPSMRTIRPAIAVPSVRFESWEGVGGRTNVTWPSLDDWTTAHEADLESLHAALEMPHCRPVVDYSKGFNALLPHLAQIKGVTIALSAACAQAVHRGEFDLALADLRAMRRLDTVMEREPTLIGHLVRVACAAITLNRAWDFLHSGDWSDEQLRRLDEVMAAGTFVDGLVHGLEGERALFLVSLSQLRPDELLDLSSAVLGAGAVGGTPNPGLPDTFEGAMELASHATGEMAAGLRRGLGRLWQFGWGDQSTVHYLDVMSRMIEAGRSASLARSRAALREVDPREVPPPAGPFRRIATLYARLTTAAYVRAVAKGFTIDTQRTLLRTDIALERFRLRHGEFPETLEALVPDYLSVVPRDPIDGKDLRYRREPDGTCLLWSVGEDGIDGGGDPSREKPSASGHYNWWLGKDAVWPRSATDAQFARWKEEEEEKRRKQAAERAGGPQQSRFTMSPELLKRYGLMPPGDTGATSAPPSAPKR